MKKSLLAILAGASLQLISLHAAAGGSSWDVQPGPNGSMRVNTSEGTYIVVIDGNHGWVGTEKEYERQRIAGVLKAQGYREMKIAGQDENTHQVVSIKLPSASVGSSNLADISTSIYFDANADKKLRRPPKPAESEYVGALWVQSDKADIQAKIVDQENHATYSPHYCHGIAGTNMRTCEFIVPRESLTHQSALLFVAAKGRPAVILRASLAQEHDKVLLEKYKVTMGSRFGLDDEDANTLKRLNELDSSIATTLPPLPPGAQEIKPRRKGCKNDALELTQAQFDAVAIGESAEDLECALGPKPHMIWPYAKPYRDYIWKMKSGGYALFSVTAKEPKTVIEKRTSPTVDILMW